MAKQKATAVFDDGEQKVTLTADYDTETRRLSLDIEYDPAVKNDCNREPGLAEVLAGILVKTLTE